MYFYYKYALHDIIGNTLNNLLIYCTFFKGDADVTKDFTVTKATYELLTVKKNCVGIVYFVY
jgi:hypothetical protein